jgi:hypothetical protein
MLCYYLSGFENVGCIAVAIKAEIWSIEHVGARTMHTVVN